VNVKRQRRGEQRQNTASENADRITCTCTQGKANGGRQGQREADEGGGAKQEVAVDGSDRTSTKRISRFRVQVGLGFKGSTELS